jgi:predicted nucleotidyltransferase
MSRILRLDPNFQPAFDGLSYANILLSKLKNLVPLLEFYLFGSCAEGLNTQNSDLDILVVVANEADIKICYKEVTKPFFSEIAVDWIVKTKKEFELEKNIGGVSRIAYTIGKRLL